MNLMVFLISLVIPLVVIGGVNAELVVNQEMVKVCPIQTFNGSEGELGQKTKRVSGDSQEGFKVIHPELLKRDKKLNLLVMYTAHWCAPCRAMYPVIEKLRKSGYIVYLLDIDDYPKTASFNSIKSVPQLLIFNKQKETIRFSGIQKIETLKKHLRTRKEQTLLKKLLRKLY